MVVDQLSCGLVVSLVSMIVENVDGHRNIKASLSSIILNLHLLTAQQTSKRPTRNQPLSCTPNPSSPSGCSSFRPSQLQPPSCKTEIHATATISCVLFSASVPLRLPSAAPSSRLPPLARSMSQPPSQHLQREKPPPSSFFHIYSYTDNPSEPSIPLSSLPTSPNTTRPSSPAPAPASQSRHPSPPSPPSQTRPA